MTDREIIHDAIREYIRKNFLDGSEIEELTGDTPLLEWGVLTSMNTTLLLTFIRTELGVNVPPLYMTGGHFADIDSIADMVCKLSVESA
ncbi:acyl carrier protein [Streptomyces purpurogeneiscleroticus]|uniref:acyl carrier protein n=1 Tax=Streptomyces purpurogeneiscleroticus TaxID=68259 RepID=UPI001CBE4C7C|nr:acyl carrier protein [Streptomyces purpurogeneiscleroticus]